VGVSGAVDPHITYSQEFSEWDACIECRLDLWEWVNNHYPTWFKAKAIAFNNSRKLIKLHTEDALARAYKERAKKKD